MSLSSSQIRVGPFPGCLLKFKRIVGPAATVFFRYRVIKKPWAPTVELVGNIEVRSKIKDKDKLGGAMVDRGVSDIMNTV
jgi:hypothetical protein